MQYQVISVERILQVGLFFTGAVALLLHEAYGWGPAILWLTGLCFLSRFPGLLRHDAGLRMLFLIYLSFGIYVAIQSSLVDGPSSEAFKAFRFVLIWPVVIAIVVFRVPAVILFAGTALGAFGGFGFSLLDIFIFGKDRAGGLMNPIHFGNLALMMGMVSGMGVLYVREISDCAYIKALLIVGLLSGVAASLLSGSRGGWVALPFAAAVFWYVFQSGKLKVNLKWVVWISIVCVSVALLSGPRIEARIASVHDDFQRMLSEGDYESSVGQRIELWRMTPVFVERSPWVGVGENEFARYRDKLMGSGEWRLVERFDHLHNDFADALAKRGVLGFLMLIVLYYGTWHVFFNYAKHSDVRVRALAGAGMLLPVLFAIYGLTETMLMSKRGMVFYLTWPPIIFALLMVVRDGSSREPLISKPLKE